MDQSVLIGLAVFLVASLAWGWHKGWFSGTKDGFSMPSLSEPASLIVPGLGLLAAGAIYYGFSSASKCKKRLAEAEAERDSAVAMLESAKRLAAREEADAAALAQSAQQVAREAQQAAQAYAQQAAPQQAAQQAAPQQAAQQTAPQQSAQQQSAQQQSAQQQAPA